MDQVTIAFCLNCGCNRGFTKITMRTEAEIRSTKFNFVEVHAVCTECGEEMYVPEVNDENTRTRAEAYQKSRQ